MRNSVYPKKRGGNRENSGRKKKWGDEPVMQIRLPVAIGNDVLQTVEDLWTKGISTQELIQRFHVLLKPKGIVVTQPSEPVSLSKGYRKIKKYQSTVSAGKGRTSFVDNNLMSGDYEKIDLNEELVRDPSKTMYLDVVGDSMIGIGIYHGDKLLVEEINPIFQRPDDGDIVVAAVNDEIMVKRYRRIAQKEFLYSENDSYEPIEISEDTSIWINGIVISSIRRFRV